MTQYRELDPREICATAGALVTRIGTPFPGSGLLRVAQERSLNAVNAVETSTGAMSSKIWQKIEILDTIAARESTT